MTRPIQRVHTDQPTIERLKALQRELEGEIDVELHLFDGRVLRGVVPERPAIMQFMDHSGQEGTNGIVRLDVGDGGVHLILMDEIEHVERRGVT
ncbi:DUF3247 domain-containing protein [Stenotrophomonas sp. ZAC14D2_NAIMI4_7]|uniref:DUF3247 family protein n=1 Tax=Stenotrophomonas sp. ZAC14D2_NAIMI4_7 TaxID=2072405 RepID=UPI000D53DA06|nr:DUF3247 family protein [Stenotrophomonas sp. ZAC14D2_NAIMI4_7]AWH18439.1 DUF3247 domain-containing protein [Stenotrophomonas sp. ZAC14D2_NAIMI4_7]